MKAWALIDPAEYKRLELRVHELLADVPLHDVWRVGLSGGGDGRTLQDVRSLMSTDGLSSANLAVRVLFGLRTAMGSVFGWDRPRYATGSGSYIHRLTDADREASLLPCGSADGLFTVLYAFENEGVGEIRNATVHAFSAMALERVESGYRLYWAIYVAPVSRLTPVYMAAIDPFRRFLVYPSILRRIHEGWIKKFPTD